MFPWGMVISLAGQAMSGALSAVNNRNIQKSADAEAARRSAYYNAKANENPLSRSEVQHILGQYDRSSQQQIENARGVATITGATPEFAAAVQKGVAEGRANLMSNVAAGASRRADYYNMLGEQAAHQKAVEDQQRRYERNATYAALAGNAASAIGPIMDGYSARKPKNTQNSAAVITPVPAQVAGSGNMSGGNAQKLATGSAARQATPRYMPAQTALPHNLPQYQIDPATGQMRVVSGGPNFEYDTLTGKVVLR